MSASSLPLTYAWSQTGGPAVTLTNASGAVARFLAEDDAGGMMLEFTLTVSDGVNTETDTIEVTINAEEIGEVTASAGADLTVDAGAMVALDGSKSSSSINLPLTYAWTQMGGPTVALTGSDGAVARFTAPSPAANIMITLQLSVTDGSATAMDTVVVTVRAKVEPQPTDDGGCGCSAAESNDTTATSSMIAALLALLSSISALRGRGRSKASNK